MAKSIYLEKNGDHFEYFICLLPEDDKKSVSVNAEILSKKAFRDVDSVENVFFAKCTCIENSAFENCKDLKTVIWSEKNTEQLEEYEISATYENENKVFNGKIAALKSKDRSFQTEYIHGINIPTVDRLTIQHGAFKNCSKLQTVVFPLLKDLDGNSVDNKIIIEKDAFEGCNSLRVVVALSSKLKITENPFEDCPNDLVFICNSNSEVAQFARENGYRYIDV